MKNIFRLIGIALGCFILLVILTATVSFIRRAWFGGPDPGGVPHVRVIEVSGVLMSSSLVLDEIKEIKKSKRARAVVVRVNSPGGLVAPSQEIFEALLDLDKKVPVVVSMGSVAASGGYYLALAGRTVFANPGTLTGSIGVVMEFVNTQKLYQWAKIERFSLTSGKFKDAGSPLRPMGPAERALFQTMIQDIHAQFRQAVKSRRGLEDAQVDAIADGRVVTGNQALQSKLVDKLGTIEDALAEARTLAKLPEDAPAVYMEKPQGLLRKLLMGDESRTDSLWSGDFWARLSGALPEAPQGPSWRVMWLAPVQ